VSQDILEVRLFVSSPSDVSSERKLVDTVVEDINHTLGKSLLARIDVVSWTPDVTPGVGRPQAIINNEIGHYDIFLGIMKARFGVPTGKAASGTEEEFDRALRQWKRDKGLRILFYFSDQPVTVKTRQELKQRGKVLAFRKRLQGLGLTGAYKSERELGTLLKRHLANCLHDIVVTARQDRDRTSVANRPRHAGKQPGSSRVPAARAAGQTARTPIITLQGDEYLTAQLSLLPGTFSSYSPEPDRPPFTRLAIPTTPGRSQGAWRRSSVYLMGDPIRPYTTQIGETRAERKLGNPEVIPELVHLNLDTLMEMYPFICGDEFKWIRMVIAELSTLPDVLDHLHRYDPDHDVRKIAAKNPSASQALMSQECLFCNAPFADDRRINEPGAESERSFIIANDFPYGPYFHYIVIPKQQVHSWEDSTPEQLFDLNCLTARFLQGLRKTQNGDDRYQVKGAPGVHIGFNSTIRHLVLTRHSRASAGASIAHVHKQIWGMARGGVNIADHLIRICKAYEAKGVDYLRRYLQALDKAGFVVWADKWVTLYVPIVQMAVHELQMIVNREGAGNYLDLTAEEINSLSKAEYIAIQILKCLRISSFNEVMLTDELKPQAKSFRLIVAFVTREVDIAVSELNHLYVVDKHPMDTVGAILEQAAEIKKKTGAKLQGTFGAFLR
jgi:diadenosine tetraphosphate (Ap4A) HIT family hydrolase